MDTLQIGLVAFDSRLLGHWNLLLGAGANVQCTIVTRYSYGDGDLAPEEAQLSLATPQVWLIDVPLPQPFGPAMLEWLRRLTVPAIAFCAHPLPTRQLGACAAPLFICHPQALASTLPLPLLLALVATSKSADSPLYVGVKPPRRRGSPGAVGRTASGAAPSDQRFYAAGVARPQTLHETAARYELPGAQLPKRYHL